MTAHIPLDGCLEDTERRWIPRKAKRVFDLIAGCILLVIFAPLMLLTWIIVRRYLGKPALFAQVRAGLNQVPFRLFKFRSMTNELDSQGELLPDEMRLPPAGQRIRKFSLDELPQILNVIKGDMSLVGPRPLLMQYVPRYSPEQARRHLARPGITGLAQVKGRNSLDWETKFAYDVWYVDHWSFSLDLKILFLTAFRVFSRENISPKGSATMEEFVGHDKPPES